MQQQGQELDVFVVGPRWPQHSKFSGYDGFHRLVGQYLKPAVSSRWPWANNAMQRVIPLPKYLVSEMLSRLLTRLAGRTYSWPIMRTEFSAARHMFGHRGAIYHVIYGETDFWFLGYVARLTRNRLVVSFHDGDAVLVRHGIDARLLKQVDAVIILGETQRGYFEARVPQERIHVVPHGVDPVYFHPDSTLTKERMVITVGGHTRDYQTFEAAIRQVWDVAPDVRFVAVSANIGHLGEPFDMAGVEFLSGISDENLRRLYQTASVAAFSFEWAIANNSVLEAMACGLPIVATDVGGVHEYVSNTAGILFPPGDSRAMADGILTLLQDSRKAQAMGAQARTEAESLSYDRVSNEMKRVYALAAARRR